MAKLFLGIALVMEGLMRQGFEMIEDVRIACLANRRKGLQALSEYALGKVYLQIVERAAPFSVIIRNIGFLIGKMPSAVKWAEDHFSAAIKAAEEMGGKGMMGMAYLDLDCCTRQGARETGRKNTFPPQ
jgi:hypothetical protein